MVLNMTSYQSYQYRKVGGIHVRVGHSRCCAAVVVWAALGVELAPNETVPLEVAVLEKDRTRQLYT